MNDALDVCCWTLVRLTFGDIKEALAANGYKPTLANVGRIIAATGPQPAVGGLRPQVQQMLTGLIAHTEGLEKQEEPIDATE